MTPEDIRDAKAFNEQLKLGASIVSNGALTVALATGAIIYDKGFAEAGHWSVIGFAVSVVMMWASIGILGHYKAEE